MDRPSILEPGGLSYDALLDGLDVALAVLDFDFQVLWANRPFASWAGDAVGRRIDEVLELAADEFPEVSLRIAMNSGYSRTLHAAWDDFRHLRLLLKPIVGRDGPRLLARLDDVTEDVNRAQKIATLHRAAQELADLAPDQLAEMNVPARVELLKVNVLRLIHDVFHYDVIEIRLLELETGELKPLLEEGMRPEAAVRRLYAREEENGVTGYVAATGKSYLCADATQDPRFLEGSPDARSSMTVPITYQDDVIGTFNVESPTVDTFTPEDLQFAELFCRELGQSIHTLNLLSAQQTTTAAQSIDAVNRAIAMPTDELLAAAGMLLSKASEGDESVRLVQRIMADLRAVKDRIRQIGVEITPLSTSSIHVPRLGGMKVLVIDQEEAIRRLAHAMLEKLGATVETSETAGGGILLAQNGVYDAILTSVSHPDARGYDTYCRLREAQPGARMILTIGFGYDSSHTLVKARQDGPTIAVYKPFRMDQLLGALTGPVRG